MGMKHLLLWMLAALLVKMSIQIASKPGADIPLGKAVKRDIYKVCGKDFQRAIVYACGASQWKRMSVQEKRNPSVSGLVQTKRNEGLENVKDQSTRASIQLQGAHEPQAKPPSEDFLRLYKPYKKHIVTAAGDVGQNTDPIGMANTIGSGFPQVKYSVRKREAPTELEYRCCNVGCTYEEIVQAYC